MLVSNMIVDESNENKFVEIGQLPSNTKMLLARFKFILDLLPDEIFLSSEASMHFRFPCPPDKQENFFRWENFEDDIKFDQPTSLIRLEKRIYSVRQLAISEFTVWETNYAQSTVIVAAKRFLNILYILMAFVHMKSDVDVEMKKIRKEYQPQ